MPKRTFTPEQVVAKLRQIEVFMSQGKTIALACKEAGITQEPYALMSAHTDLCGGC
jgi:putative transposase